MRAHCTLVALIIATTSSAQLLNGSFENGLGGDLSYWNHSCIAQSAADGAPSSGDWSAEVEASNPQGCLPGMLYQVVPSAHDGMPFFLGGWCRNTEGPWVPMIGIDIGVMSAGGVITPMNLGPTTTNNTWTWLSFNDTLQLGFEEQAVVICDPGFVGGPAFALARFDGITLDLVIAEGIAENDPHQLGLHLAPDQRSLAVSLSDPGPCTITIADATGRTLASQTITALGGNEWTTVQVPSTANGAMIVEALSARSRRCARIVITR